MLMLMLMANATILVVIKASLCSNNWLLEANLTRRTAKIVVLNSCAYLELRLLKYLSPVSGNIAKNRCF